MTLTTTQRRRMTAILSARLANLDAGKRPLAPKDRYAPKDVPLPRL
jgi:hypothetical protein